MISWTIGPSETEHIDYARITFGLRQIKTCPEINHVDDDDIA